MLTWAVRLRESGTTLERLPVARKVAVERYENHSTFPSLAKFPPRGASLIRSPGRDTPERGLPRSGQRGPGAPTDRLPPEVAATSPGRPVPRPLGWKTSSMPPSLPNRWGQGCQTELLHLKTPP